MCTFGAVGGTQAWWSVGGRRRKTPSPRALAVLVLSMAERSSEGLNKMSSEPLVADLDSPAITSPGLRYMNGESSPSPVFRVKE